MRNVCRGGSPWRMAATATAITTRANPAVAKRRRCRCMKRLLIRTPHYSVTVAIGTRRGVAPPPRLPGWSAGSSPENGPGLSFAPTPLAGVERGFITRRRPSHHFAPTPASGVGANFTSRLLLVTNPRSTPASGVGADKCSFDRQELHRVGDDKAVRVIIANLDPAGFPRGERKGAQGNRLLILGRLPLVDLHRAFAVG